MIALPGTVLVFIPVAEFDKRIETMGNFQVHRSILSYILLLIVLPLSGLTLFPAGKCSGSSNLNYCYQTPVQTDDGWKTALIDAKAMDAGKIIRLMRKIFKNEYQDIHGLLLVKDRTLILEEYFLGFHREKAHEIRSATKSIGSMLIGIAIDHHFIKGVDEKIYPFFKAYAAGAKWDDKAKNITLENLLSMTSGFDCDDHADPAFQCEKAMYQSDDWVAYALNLPMTYAPGKHWAYNSSSLILISEVIAKTSKMTVPDFADAYLFEPLDIDTFHWGFSPKGRAFIAGNAKMKPRDMAKIGLLMLNRGTWQGKQLISESWVDASTRAHVKSSSNWAYGYLWWNGKQLFGKQNITAYWAAGNGGNYIFVCPALNLVAVFTGGNYNSILEVQPFGMLVNYIIPAFLPPMAPRQTAAVVQTNLDAYTGEYRSTQGRMQLSVVKNGKGLYCTLLGRTLQMYPKKKDLFFIPDEIFGDWIIRFERNKEDEATAAIGYAAFQNIRFKKNENLK